ncbi:hypothetical protein CDD82_4080 [Ophiocordyceps australis]|uniref:Uncharacterized protein n=1 Tax=Ophiocordyceps australis TaxID=1399860 RepID=A0A2C5Z933_9HYPO|nr:hypothetical protein CDD82_4080 [Ophiocordyceps australis]
MRRWRVLPAKGGVLVHGHDALNTHGRLAWRQLGASSVPARCQLGAGLIYTLGSHVRLSGAQLVLGALDAPGLSFYPSARRIPPQGAPPPGENPMALEAQNTPMFDAL